MQQLDVPSYNFRCHFISNRPHKVPVPPQFSSPQLLLQLRMTTKQLPRRNTLENLYCRAGTVFRCGQQKQVNVVRHHLKRVNLKLVALCNALENLLQTISHRTLQNQFAVLRNPDEVVLEVVHRVLGTLNRTHLPYTNSRIRLWRISAFLPPASWGVSQRRLFMKRSCK
jgi:hypothetical protein